MLTHRPASRTTPVVIALVPSFVLLLATSAFPQSDTNQIAAELDTLALQSVSIAPPTDLQARDTPDDAGNSIDLEWRLSSDDAAQVTRYLVLRSSAADGVFHVVGETTRGQNRYTDNTTHPDSLYYYRIAAVSDPVGDGVTGVAVAESETAGPIRSEAQWFNKRRIWIALWTLVVCTAILVFIAQARSGKELYVRKIAGIDAVEEAIGRATEMGKKVLYIPGIQDMDDVQTIAAVTILGRVARIAAENDTQLEVPVCKSLVMVTAREAVREAYSKAGRPDSFREDQVHYLTDDQFGYAAAIDGIVVREKPATMFYMGAFFAESLILAETGNAAGAIQIAGTGQPAQLPFFIAACDYTLIGEELFAASAYLAREPKLLGSLKGQDLAKGLFLVSIIIGIILELAGVGFLRILEVS